MKIRIKSNYLTRYVLQDYGNMEPLLTFTPFVLVCILFILFPSHSHPLSALYFFPLLSVVLLLSVFSVWKLRWFARMGNLWACFHMLFRINSDFGSLDSRTFHFHAASDFHSTFITFSENTHRWGCEQDIKRKCARERETERNIFVCTFIIEADDCYKNAVRRISSPFYSQWLCQVKEKMKVLYMHDIYGNVETISNKLFFINAIYKCVCSLLFPFFPLSR